MSLIANIVTRIKWDRSSLSESPVHLGATSAPAFTRGSAGGGGLDRSILFVADGQGLADASNQVLQLVKGLRERGWRTDVVSTGSDGPIRLQLRDAGARFYTLDAKAAFANPRAIVRLAALVRRLKPSVLHGHLLQANLLTRLTRIVADVPVLVSTANDISEGGWPSTWAYRLTDGLADATTHSSRWAVDRSLRNGAVSSRRIRFVPNGIDLKPFQISGLDRLQLRSKLNLGDSFVWLGVGRFEQDDDFPNMLRAFADTLNGPEHNSILLLAGVGSLQLKMKRLAKKMRIARRVRFLGARLETSTLMAAADALVFSSVGETTPLVLQRAAASGLPAVATDVGANREIVIDNFSGLLVPPVNTDALAAAMIRMMEFPAIKREAMSHAARQHVADRYSMDKVLDCWEGIYSELLDAKHVGQGPAR